MLYSYVDVDTLNSYYGDLLKESLFIEKCPIINHMIVNVFRNYFFPK